MRLAEVLVELDAGGRARREAWHGGKLWIARTTAIGFTEITMTLNGSGGVIEWPAVLGRADWCADDWHMLTEDEAEAGLRQAQAVETAQADESVAEPASVHATS